jgi:hypothetical protein
MKNYKKTLLNPYTSNMLDTHVYNDTEFPSSIKIQDAPPN